MLAGDDFYMRKSEGGRREKSKAQQREVRAAGRIFSGELNYVSPSFINLLWRARATTRPHLEHIWRIHTSHWSPAAAP